MTQPTTQVGLVCKTCGSPIPTNAAPGAQVTCNCCGAVNTVPQPTDTLPVQSV